MSDDLLCNTPYRHIRPFKRGKQGFAGLVENKETGTRLVYKVSQHIDFLMEHEKVVASRLNEVKNPVFARLVESGIYPVNPSSRAKHPWEKCERAVKKLVLFYEYIPGYSLSKIIKKKKDTVSVKTIIASIKIIMTSLYCAFKQVGFTHYDLHTSNILMKKCDPDLVFVIHDGSGNAFALPTFGYIPSIIDFGFSYIDTIDNGPMYQSLAHTNVGFVSCAMDKFADTKLFLCSVSSQMMRHRKTKEVMRLRKFVKSTFKELDVDFDCGWDLNDEESIGNEALNFLHRANKKEISELFYKYDAYAVDILTSLVQLPITAGGPGESDEGLLNYYKIFLKQFAKFEMHVQSSYSRLRILRAVVETARSVMAKYYNKKKQREAIIEFQSNVLREVDEIARHVSVGDINFEKMLCSLLLFGRAFEGYLQKKLGTFLAARHRKYQKLKCKSSIEIYGAMDLKIASDTIFTSRNTFLHIVSFREPVLTRIENQSHLDAINTKHSISKGMAILNLEFAGRPESIGPGNGNGTQVRRTLFKPCR
jgi:hypothetical protein